MTRTLKNLLALCGTVLAVSLAANVAAAPADTATDPMPFLALTGVPALDGDASTPACALQAPAGEAAPTPLALSGCVCTFCNLCGFANCQATDGTSCSAPGASKRCYVSPACACEWGVCRCEANGTWSCFW
jgi:hypothetical protein